MIPAGGSAGLCSPWSGRRRALSSRTPRAPRVRVARCADPAPAAFVSAVTYSAAPGHAVDQPAAGQPVARHLSRILTKLRLLHRETHCTWVLSSVSCWSSAAATAAAQPPPPPTPLRLPGRSLIGRREEADDISDWLVGLALWPAPCARCARLCPASTAPRLFTPRLGRHGGPPAGASRPMIKAGPTRPPRGPPTRLRPVVGAARPHPGGPHSS